MNSYKLKWTPWFIALLVRVVEKDHPLRSYNKVPLKLTRTPRLAQHPLRTRFGHASFGDPKKDVATPRPASLDMQFCPMLGKGAGCVVQRNIAKMNVPMEQKMLLVPQAGGSGGSGRSGKGETSASSTSMSQKSGNAKGKNGGGKPTSSSSGEPMAKEQGQGDPKVASVGSALDGDAGAKASTGGSGDSGHSEAAKKESELMDEVTTLLRSLRAAVKVCSIKRISGDEEEGRFVRWWCNALSSEL